MPQNAITPFATVLLLALAAQFPSTAFPQTPVQVTVDYSVSTGPSNQVASGVLHGINASSSAQYLVDGMKVGQDRGMAYIKLMVQGSDAAATVVSETNATEPGQFEPNLFDSATHTRVSDTGAKLMVGLYYYSGHTGNSYWPGDGGNQATWRTMVADLYNYSVTNNLSVYSWIPWNEPNLQWKGSTSPGGSVRNTAAFYQAWLNAYQQVKSLNANARIQGPEISSFSTSYLEAFLTFCKANNCLPNILTWHELTGSAPQDIEAHTATIKSWMISNGITPMPLAVTEYAGGHYADPTSYSPGQLTTYIAKLERSSVASGLAFGVKSCWAYVGSDSAFIATLADLADPKTATYPTGGWWIYNAYKDATGVAVSETSSNTAVVDCFAAYDANLWRSVILLGDPVGGSASTVTLTLKNLNNATTLTHSGVTHLRVETLTPTSILTQPAVALEGDYTTSNNAVTITLPTLAAQNAYRILVNSAVAAETATYFEAHSLPVTYTAGLQYTTYTQSGSRDGTATSLNATAVDNAITYTINVPTAGVYDLRAGFKSGNSHAMLQLYVNGAAVGGPKDQYRSGIAFYNEDYGNVHLPAGNSTLEFVAVNKNSASSNYTMSFDYFKLVTLSR